MHANLSSIACIAMYTWLMRALCFGDVFDYLESAVAAIPQWLFCFARPTEA